MHTKWGRGAYNRIFFIDKLRKLGHHKIRECCMYYSYWWSKGTYNKYTYVVIYITLSYKNSKKYTQSIRSLLHNRAFFHSLFRTLLLNQNPNKRRYVSQSLKLLLHCYYYYYILILLILIFIGTYIYLGNNSHPLGSTGGPKQSGLFSVVLEPPRLLSRLIKKLAIF